jgi:hypothetical protein
VVFSSIAGNDESGIFSWSITMQNFNPKNFKATSHLTMLRRYRGGASLEPTEERSSSSVADQGEGLNQVQRRYFNIALVGGTPLNSNPNSGTPCFYDQTFSQSLIDSPKEWTCGIVRFSVPFFNVPLFTDPQFDNPSTPATITWTNPAFPLVGGINQISSIITVNNAVGGYVVDPFNPSFVYLIQHWVDATQLSMNALATAANLLLAVPIVPPLVTYNAGTQIITIQSQPGIFYPSNGSLGNGAISMYMNEQAYRFWPTLPVEFPNFINPSQFARVRLGVANVRSGFLLAEQIVGADMGSPQSAGILTTALVAGNTTVQLFFTGGLLLSLAPGQAVVLHDTVSAVRQTVFVGAGGAQITDTVLNVLAFTPIIAFPITTTTVEFSLYQQITVTTAPQYMAPGTVMQLTNNVGNSMTVVSSGQPYLTNTANNIVIPCQPFAGNTTYTLAAVSVLTVQSDPADVITTETPVPPTWTSITSIRMKSNYLPIVPETSPSILSAKQNAGTVSPVTMITDFVMSTAGQAQTRDVVQYVTENPRWIDMVGDNEMRRVDVQVVWVDIQGVEHPIYLNQGERFDVKIAFKRKYTMSRSGF